MAGLINSLCPCGFLWFFVFFCVCNCLPSFLPRASTFLRIPHSIPLASFSYLSVRLQLNRSYNSSCPSLFPCGNRSWRNLAASCWKRCTSLVLGDFGRQSELGWCPNPPEALEWLPSPKTQIQTGLQIR